VKNFQTGFRRLPHAIQMRVANVVYLTAALSLAVVGVVGGLVLELAGAEAA
jgi:hypothetical protein